MVKTLNYSNLVKMIFKQNILFVLVHVQKFVVLGNFISRAFEVSIKTIAL